MNRFKKTILFIAISLAPFSTSFSEVRNIKRELSGFNVPTSIKQPGKIVETIHWSDVKGNNLLVLSESITSTRSDAPNRSASLFAAHYLKRQDNWERQWKVEDFENDCPVDVGAAFIPVSVEITDLDKNGYSEVSFMYRVFCTGGIDPQTLKLVMYEEKKKYAIRGETLVKLPEQPAYGGKMKIDASFKTAPKEFLPFATSQWNKYRIYP